MVIFHCIYYLGAFIPRGDYVQILQNPALRLFLQGHFGVDIFFVISGFLITSLLLNECHTTGGISLRGFYIRRAFRILPAYATVLLLGLLVLGREAHSANAWANLLFVNNFLPFREQCLPWTWSLAIEEQFYLVFPVVLIGLHAVLKNQRHVVAVFAGALGAGFVINYFLMHAHQIYTPPPLHTVLGEQEFYRYFDGVYDKTYTRYGGILCGVLVAYLAESKRLISALLRHPMLARAGLLACLAVIGILVIQPMYVSADQSIPREIFVIWAASIRYVFAMLIGYIVLYTQAQAQGSIAQVGGALTQQRGKREGLMSRVLSARGWYPFAELSYGAYLLHPLAILVVYGWMPIDEPGFAALSLRFAIIYAVTFGAAYLLYYAVERPFREKGRRLSRLRSRSGSIRPTR